MRKDVRLGLAIGGSAIVIVACSVLFFRNPEPQPNPQASQNPPVVPDQPGNALSGGSALPESRPALVGGAGDTAQNSVVVGPSDAHGMGLPGMHGAGAAGTNLGGTSTVESTGAGTGVGGTRNWQALLDNGDALLPRTRTPDTTEPGVGNAENRTEPVVVPPGFGSNSNSGGTALEPVVLPPSTGPKTYTVALGDTYWTIAQAEYGNGAYYSHIMRANPSVPANRLKAGVKLVIPSRSEVVPSGAQPVVAAANLDSRTQYRVQKGDNLNTICKQLYGTTDKVSKLYQLNKDLIGSNPNSLKLGMVLQLPDPPAGTEISPAFGVIQ